MAIIEGRFGNNRLLGGSANDTIKGGFGDDTIDGGAGNDTIDDGFGNNTIKGGFGNDTIEGGFDKDTIDGGAGNDNIDGGSGNDSLLGGADNDRLIGGFGNDRLFGGFGNDTISGDFGNNDNLITTDNQTISLTGNNNKLITNDNQSIGLTDVLTGGQGNDIFDFNSVLESQPGVLRDVITDFVGNGNLPGDRIDLSTIDANSNIAGNQAFTFIGSSVFFAIGQIRYAGGILQGNTAGNLSPEFEIQLTGTPQLVANDIIV
ncbi:calcium-binding protein [Nostoc sp. ChiVER01]|uniref:calcium-binding protein n=1 Tax=Nostoc sp. ChiVER01 TaxID=3075382 RepID=UPI002AD4E438|nr:calcium-binding protein [Nostoc sp. ChiVER01]MDZ8225484.1 calcium-binding protein [Nostoc sp. ChiVER01]